MAIVKFELKDQAKLNHALSLLATLAIKRQQIKLIFANDGIYASSIAACKSLSINVYFEAAALLDGYALTAAPHSNKVFGVSVSSLISCLKEGGRIEVDEEFISSITEHEGFSQKTRIRLLHVLPDQFEDENETNSTVVTTNADLLHGILTDFQSTFGVGTSDASISLKISAESSMEIECVDPSSGMSMRSLVPGRSVKVEGISDVEMWFKFWVFLSMDKILQQMGTSLVRIEFSNHMLRIEHRPIPSSNSGVAFYLSALR
jgi:hypothetical protein